MNKKELIGLETGKARKILEKKEIVASIDKDITNSTSLEYSIVK